MPNQIRYNSNIGSTASTYRGEKPVTDSDFLKRYASDNFVIKEGVISEVFAGGYIAQVTYGNGSNMAIWLSGVLGGFSETQSLAIPSAGSKVLVYAPISGPNIILGIMPQFNVQDGINYDVEHSNVNYSTEKQHNSITTTEQPVAINYNSDRPLDTSPGDWGYINEVGNLIALLRGLLLLKASNSSQIQLHTIDDLLRIVSLKCYEHFSALGKDVIYNDRGMLSREIEYSIKQPEILGETQYADITKAGTDYLLEPKDKKDQNDRIKIHVGYVGDLVHLYLSKPDSTGIAEIYLGKNGSINCKSTKSVEFNKVDRISVPNRKEEYYKSKEFTEQTVKEFTYTDGSKEVQENDRDDWNKTKFEKKVYDDKNWTIPDPNIPATESGENAYKETKAKFSLRDDGSVILSDNKDSFIELDGAGNISLSCKGNIYLKNGEELVCLTGKNINLRAKENLDISCTEGDVRVKAENALQLYTKKKGILLETDSKDLPNTELYEKHVYSGIKLKTNNESPILLDSGQNIVNWANANIVSKAEHEIREDALNITMNASQQILEHCDEFFCDSSYYKINTSQYISRFIDMYETGKSFVISGSIAGKIHGGYSTDVNHIHSRGSDHMVYTRSCVKGVRGKLIRIDKQNIQFDNELQKITPDPLYQLLTPFEKEKLDLTKFSFRSGQFSGRIYEDGWQSEADGNWDLTKDIVKETAPFPGFNFANYFRYITPSGIQDHGGEFTVTPISGFKI